ncbi:MAG TPA: hypothetical protein VG938_00655 [Verrucomicrobiae bacterium]|nr:hypothetical protein [Verrucomicrobiae bacterium]
MKTHVKFALILVTAVIAFGAFSRADPPSNDLLLWLSADSGVTVSAGTSNVTVWADKSPLGNNATTSFGTPQLGSKAFPNGNFPVIGFSGGSGFAVDNPRQFDLQTVSIYVVADVNSAVASECFVAHWNGFALGISDGVGGRVKWVTYNGSPLGVNSMEPASGADMSNGVPYLVTGTFEQNVEKSVYVNGLLASTATANLGSITYPGNPNMDIGMLFSTGGQNLVGHIAEILVYSSASAAQRSAVENYLNAKYFLKSGPPKVTSQPASQQVAEFAPVTFNAAVDGTLPFTFQWFKDNVSIPGATNVSYSISSALTGDAGSYSIAVTNSLGYTNSQSAVLTIIADTNPPVILSALLNYTNNTSVTVSFSELVDPATATNIANYSIDHSAIISGAIPIPQTTNVYWSNYINSVILTTSPITTQSVVTVSGVMDRAANSSVIQATIPVPLTTVTPPPSDNRLLWLEADTAVLADDVGVYEWDDQSGAANEHGAFFSVGNAQVGQVSFPNAIHPVVTFDGATALSVDHSTDFKATNLTMYIVADVDNTTASRIFVAYWAGWGMGISDGLPGVLKFITVPAGLGIDSMEPPASHLGNRVPSLIMGSFAYPGNKTLTVDGVQVGNKTNPATIDYSGAGGVSIGSLGPSGGQSLKGDIAEILIYTNVSPAQDAAVQSYLTSKYFSPSANPIGLVSATRGAQSTNVTVVFSQSVNTTTATNASNYAIDHGVTVSGARLVSPTSVALTTSPINAGPTYTLTVNGVNDWAGNGIAANSQIVVGGISAPQLDVTLLGGSVSITWTAQAPYKLQSADNLNGPWSDVPSASSPYMTNPTQSAKFYRLSQ